MKQGSFKAVRIAVCFILMAGIAVFSAFAQDKMIDYTSFILESFNGDTTSHEWTIGDRTYTYDYSWEIDASKFASNIGGDQFPKLTYVPSWPQAIFGVNRAGRELNSLGIWGKFDRRGYNWMDLYPVDPDGNPFEIPIPGRVSAIDLWVWGSNLNFYMEAYVRDYNGIVYALDMGNLTFAGWRNLVARIPNHIPQEKRILPRYGGLTFVKFRVWTTPMERVDNFYVYFKQLKVLTDIFETFFDGDELANPDRIQEFWGN